MNKILVIAAHPDDEVLGCGGTILKHIKEGDQVHVLLLGDGASSRGGSQEEIKKRLAQAKKAAQILGIKKLFLEQILDNRFDAMPLLDIIKKVEKVVLKIKPAIVYTHFGEDLNIDHRLTFQAVLTACRPQPKFCVKKILSFEVLSSTEWQEKKQKKTFNPNYYNDIGGFIDKKIKAIESYGEELRQYPHPRSKEGVRILAQYRGIESGLKYAEAFRIVRDIN